MDSLSRLGKALDTHSVVKSEAFREFMATAIVIRPALLRGGPNGHGFLHRT